MAEYFGIVVWLLFVACIWFILYAKEQSDKAERGEMSYPFSEEKKRDASKKLKESKEYEKNILAQRGWKCECGRVNPRQTGTCACGRHRDSRKEKEIGAIDDKRAYSNINMRETFSAHSVERKNAKQVQEGKKYFELEVEERKKFFELQIKAENRRYVLHELTDEEQEILGKWAEVFWENCSNVLKKSTGDLKQDKIEGMKLIVDYIMSWCWREKDVFANTKITPGRLCYNYRTSYGGTCYDGGCYSDEGDQEYYLEIRVVSMDSFRSEIEKLRSNYIRLFENFEYRAQLPLTDCYVYAPDGGNIWIEAPFGLACGLHMELC